MGGFFVMKSIDLQVQKLKFILSISKRIALGEITSSDIERLKELANTFDVPRANLLYGKILFKGIGTLEDEEGARKHFDFVYEKGNHNLLTDLGLFLLTYGDNSTEEFAFLCLEKAKDELEELTRYFSNDENELFVA